MRNIHLNQKQREGIVIDTCGVIAILENPKTCFRMKKILSRKTRILVPDFVIRELKKVRNLSEYEVIPAISSILRKPISIVRCNCDIRADAAQMESKYTKAHFPDTLLLALAKFGAYAILSYDTGLISTARAEGIKIIGDRR